MKAKISLKVICLLLLLATLFSLSAPVFAVEITPENLTPADIVEEDESKREQYVKHYLTGDGSYYAVAYAEQVNYLDDDGVWQEVDNTLSSDLLGDASNKNNEKFKVKFKNKANKEDLVSIQTDDFKVSWGLSISEDGESFAALNKVKKDIAESSAPKDITKTTDTHALGKAVSSISYKAAFGDYLDVRYTVSHEKVKEDIILNEASDFKAYRATYDISKIDGCTVTLQDDGSVVFNDKDGEMLFTAASPVMYDSDGATSADISVTLTATAKTAQITYTPSPAWLNSPDRVYPVTVDPSMSSARATNYVTDVSAYYEGRYMPTSATDPYLYVGNDYFTYVKFSHYPTLPDNCTMQGVSIVFHTDTAAAASENPQGQIRLAEVTSYWGYDTPFWLTCTLTDPSTFPTEGRWSSWYNIADCFTPITTDITQLSVEIPSSFWSTEGYMDYFCYINGFQVYATDTNYITYNLFSTKSSQDAAYRPCMVVRYTGEGSAVTIDTSRTYRIKNAATGRYLDFNTFSTATMNDYGDADSQKFNITYDTVSGLAQIKAIGTNYYLDYQLTEYLDWPFFIEPEYYSNPSNDRAWYLIARPNGTFNIISAHMSNFALSAASDDIYSVKAAVYNDNSTTTNNYQRWVLEDFDCYYPTSLGGKIYLEYEPGKRYKFVVPYNVASRSSGDPDVVTFDDTGMLTIHDIGVSFVSGTTVFNYTDENGNPASETYQYYYYVYVLLPDGEYIFKNTFYNKFLEADSTAPSQEDSPPTVLKDISLEHQRWELIRVDGEYYNIKSLDSGKMLTSPETIGSITYESTETNANNQKWKFYRNGLNSYELIPYNNTSAHLSVIDTVIGVSSHAAIISTANPDQKKSWNLMCLNRGEILLISIFDEYSSHDSDYMNAYNDIVALLINSNYTECNLIITDYISKEDAISYLENSRVAVILTHGAATYNSPINLSSSGQPHLTTYDIYNFNDNIPLVDFNNLELLVYWACYTAKHSTRSIAQASVNAGADYSVGFYDEISNNSSRDWMADFFTYYLQGFSVNECAELATPTNYDSSTDVGSYRVFQAHEENEP